MPDLVALALPGGPAFVEALRRIWDRGDAAAPIDPRLPAPARAALLRGPGPRPPGGRRRASTAVAGGRPVEPGDALVVATSGTTGAPRGRRAHPRRRGRVGARHQRPAGCRRPRRLAGLPPALPRRRAVRGDAGDRHGHAPHGAPGLRRRRPSRRRRAAGATLVSLVPTALRRIDPALFRVIVLGGSRPPAERPANTVATYGLTESGSGVVYDGRPLDGVEVRVDRRRRDPAPRPDAAALLPGRHRPQGRGRVAAHGRPRRVDGRRPAPCAGSPGRPDRHRRRERLAGAGRGPPERPPGRGRGGRRRSGRTRSGASGSSPSWCPAPRTAVPASTSSGTG